MIRFYTQWIQWKVPSMSSVIENSLVWLCDHCNFCDITPLTWDNLEEGLG